MKFPAVRVMVTDGQKGYYARVERATESASPEYGKEAGAFRPTGRQNPRRSLILAVLASGREIFGIS